MGGIGLRMGYDEQLRSLPVPTLEQTAQFAEHVADNHSWYKHLPFFPPGVSFVFFPNAHAGRGVKAEGDRFTVYDIECGDYFAHHSRLSTAEYVAQFGHWDYWVDDNPRVLDPQPGPWLYSPDGSQKELLAEGPKRQWSCRLTAFLKPAPGMFKLRGSDLEREVKAFTASGRRTLSGTLLGMFGWRGRVCVEDPIVGRYRAVATELRLAAGSMSWGGNPALLQFIESEATAQRQLLLDTLHRVRSAWSENQGVRA